jgi:SulP family sulfate permease
VKGEELYILKLQGFVFFGTAQSLVERIRRRVSEAQHRRPHFLVLSFRRVTGLDSSAVSSLVRLRQWAQTQQISLVLADLSSELERQLARGGLTGAEAPPRLFPTLDHAVEWCEDQILLSEEISGAEAPPALPEQLESQFPQPQRVSALMAYLEKTVLGAGSYLFRQGDPAGDLYFIESGQLTVQLEFPAEKPLRLRTLRAGTVVGEVGLYLREGTRTASVIAVQPSTLYRLSARSLQQLEESDPALASAFHQYLARLMAERLARSVATLEALLD